MRLHAPCLLVADDIHHVSCDIRRCVYVAAGEPRRARCHYHAHCRSPPPTPLCRVAAIVMSPSNTPIGCGTAVTIAVRWRLQKHNAGIAGRVVECVVVSQATAFASNTTHKAHATSGHAAPATPASFHAVGIRRRQQPLLRQAERQRGRCGGGQPPKADSGQKVRQAWCRSNGAER